MAWYAYCLSNKESFPELARHRKPIPLETIHGVSGNQVFLYPASDLAVVVSESNPQEVMNQKAGMEHAQVIAECFKHTTVLPFRFGTIFETDESLRKSIRSNQRQFLCNLEKLQGKTEMHIKIQVEDGCREQSMNGHIEPVSGVGREYLSHLREAASRQRDRQTRARSVTFQMHRNLMPLDEEVSCRMMENGRMLLDIAHLIQRKQVERYQNKFAQMAVQMTQCQMQISGPWPPYHFVHKLTRSHHASVQSVQAPQPVAVTVEEPTSVQAVLA